MPTLHKMEERPRGLISAIVAAFLEGPPSILFLAIAILLGIMAIVATPREEEPQIVVPMADVFVSFPGHSAAEVEELVTRPLERLLWQIDGVEHVYSISRRDGAMVTVRFYVGEDRERSLIKLRDRIEANRDLVPPGVTGWIVKPVEIDDVPIVTLTLFGEGYDDATLRRLAEEMKARLDAVRNLSRTEIVGGRPREIRVEPDLEAMAARKIDLTDLLRVLEANSRTWPAGFVYGRVAGPRGDSPSSSLARPSSSSPEILRLLPGPLLTDVEMVRKTIVAYREGPIRVEDIAEVREGPADPEHYVYLGFGPGGGDESRRGRRYPAVTLAFSKKKGTNAVTVAEEILSKTDRLRAEILPPDVEVLVTRNYGETANAKVNDLLSSMVFAVLTVVGLIFFTMGWREAIVVGLAVPVSFALALFVNWIAGYTINRVTLFALILSLGLVVDDPITNVDNIQRHIREGRRKPYLATLFAVQEVLPPVILSTLAIILSFTPMFFITGMMGPYMGPMAINVPLTVTFSTVCALTFVPWLSYRLLKGSASSHKEGEFAAISEGEEGKAATSADGTDVTPAWVRRLYRFALSPFLSPRGAWLLLGIVALLFLLSCSLALLRKVPLKMLPFDNKDELQLIVDLPHGASQEAMDAVVQDLEAHLATVPEVVAYTSYIGTAAPIDFNGLVRHYGMRQQPHQADLRIHFLPKAKRIQQSHAIALRERDALTRIAQRHGAKLKIVEVSPGPPVLSTLTIEVYGSPAMSYEELLRGAKALQQELRAEDPRHIAEVDDMSETPHPRLAFHLDRDKAAAHGLHLASIASYLKTAMEGTTAGILHLEGEREPRLLRLRLPFDDRIDPQRLASLGIRTATSAFVQLGELGTFREEVEDQPIFHKDLERVVFVTAECVGRPPGEIVLDMQQRLAANPQALGGGSNRRADLRLEWAGEGEWRITVQVFRDLGIAFGVALIGIYFLLTIQMRSFAMPWLVMLAIPLTAIGILPGFYLLNVVAGGEVGGYPDPIFFTATGMIGMIALGGIVIRNSIVLIEFVQDARRGGMPLREALLASGAVRFRPIILTALTTLLGAWPITLDPVFSGLAWALIFGLIASTLFTLLIVPTVYYLVETRAATA